MLDRQTHTLEPLAEGQPRCASAVTILQGDVYVVNFMVLNGCQQNEIACWMRQAGSPNSRESGRRGGNWDRGGVAFFFGVSTTSMHDELE